MADPSIIEDELANSIDKARKEITVLFTDIVDSSRYWDQYGDVKGRLMVDRHNRLVFPVVDKFNGRVLKTIGDGLMAVFKRPNDALNAAIAIQQILKKMRDADRSFHAKVRIGLHTGMAIVEKNDVFGDAVNVAKRVEDFGDANEIYLSQATAEILKGKSHAFHKKGSFIPKGKRDPMTVFRCRWNEYKDFTRGLKLISDFPLDSREKGDIVAYMLIATIVLTTLYFVYGRYVITDVAIEAPMEIKLLIMNPLLVVNIYDFVIPTLLCAVLASALMLMWMKTIPYVVMRLLKGVAGFGVGFVLIYWSAIQFDISFATSPKQEVGRTQARFVRLGPDSVNAIIGSYVQGETAYEFFKQDVIVPITNAPEIHRKLRFLATKDGKGQETKAKVLAVWQAKNLAKYKPQRWYFRLLDLCAVCLGCMGFVSGFMNFHISPR